MAASGDVDFRCISFRIARIVLYNNRLSPDVAAIVSQNGIGEDCVISTLSSARACDLR